MSGTTFITRARVRRTMADEWHSLPADDVLRRLDASPLGLNASDAARRLARIGPNELVRTARISPWRILLAQFVDVLVIVLIIAAIISAVLGTLQGELSDLYDAILIVAIVIMNAILGFFQEYRAERSLGALKGLAAPKAHVLREGGIVAIPARELVPGDVTVLAAGDRVAADARLLEAADLRLNEASLTGESQPVVKAIEPLPRDSFVGDRKNMVFMGTAVEGGRGKAVGAASVICSEKTGTLTKGEMNVRILLAGPRSYEVTGEGFDPKGTVKADGPLADLAADAGLRNILECGVLCNDATLKRDRDRWVVEGDPTEGALIVAAVRAGLDVGAVRTRWPRVAEVAFTSERKKMSTLHAALPPSEVQEILAVPEGERHQEHTSELQSPTYL